MSIIYETRNLVKSFKSGSSKIDVIKGVNLKIPEKKLTILKGRSGSGKTTLLNLLGTLDEPTSGEIFFENKSITAMSRDETDEIRRLKIGFVFQSIALIPTMTAYENVEFALRIAGYDKSKMKERAEECLHLVGLGKRMHHRTNELSGGEQQRVSIARAIAHKPSVIFADEPTAALDSRTGLQVVKMFRDLVLQEGITIIMTTHDPNMMELGDVVYAIDDGMIEEETNHDKM